MGCPEYFSDPGARTEAVSYKPPRRRKQPKMFRGMDSRPGQTLNHLNQ